MTTSVWIVFSVIHIISFVLSLTSVSSAKELDKDDENF